MPGFFAGKSARGPEGRNEKKGVISMSKTTTKNEVQAASKKKDGKPGKREAPPSPKRRWR
jgi:hypothetical protein